MKAVRVGNDVRNLEIPVTRLGIEFTDWDSLVDFKVHAVERNRKKYFVAPSTLYKEPGMLRLYFEDSDLQVGVYDLLITFSFVDPINPDGLQAKALDIQKAFAIVEHTAQEVDAQDEFAIELNYAKDGLSYYQIWAQYFEGTQEDMFAWHRQPAVDAAAALDLLSQEVTENENARINAEQTRSTQETTRQQNETTRNTAETSRATAETGRVNAESSRVTAEQTRSTQETTRQQNETTRNTAETSRATAETRRVNAESARVTAEQTRSTQEATRQQNETTRNTAETSRATAETGRVNAESARVTAEQTRSTQEATRQQNETTRGTAETAREESESTRQSNEQTRIDNEAGRAAVMALKADHGYVNNPKTLKEVEDLLRELAGIPDVFGFRYLIDQADDRVEAVNDVAYDYATGVAPAGSKRAKLLSKLRPFQCNLDGSNKEFLQDDVRMTVGWKPSDLTNPLKLQMVQITRFYYRSFQYEGYNYVLFSEVAPELIATFTDATQWKEIQPCGYARYRGVRQLVEGQQMLLSYSGQFPTASVNLINFQTSAKNTNAKATVIPYFVYEAITLLMTMELGRRNAQAFYGGITNASTSYANAAVTGVTDVLTTPSGEVDVEWQLGSFTKQFRWRFIECVYGQIWNLLTGIYYVYDAATELNKVYMTRDFGKINTNSNYAEHVLIGSTPSVNGWIKEFIPGTIVASELEGSSTTYAADYNYTSATTATRIARAGGSSVNGGSAGPFALNSDYSPASAYASIGASLVLPE